MRTVTTTSPFGSALNGASEGQEVGSTPHRAACSATWSWGSSPTRADGRQRSQGDRGTARGAARPRHAGPRGRTRAPLGGLNQVGLPVAVPRDPGVPPVDPREAVAVDGRVAGPRLPLGCLHHHRRLVRRGVGAPGRRGCATSSMGRSLGIAARSNGRARSWTPLIDRVADGDRLRVSVLVVRRPRRRRSRRRSPSSP